MEERKSVQSSPEKLAGADPEEVQEEQPSFTQAPDGQKSEAPVRMHTEDMAAAEPEQSEHASTTEAQDEVHELEQEAVPDSASQDGTLPELDEAWCQGKFLVNITRYSEAFLQNQFSRHEEKEYCDFFNKLADAIMLNFPNAEIVGNHERPSYDGCFDVYLRGVGKLQRRDREGRLYLFKKKNNGGRWPTQ